MMRTSFRRGRFASAMLLISGLLFAVSNVRAQSDVTTGLEVFPTIQLGDLGSSSKEPVSFTAQYRRVNASTGELSVTAVLASDHYIYSVTQKPGGPIRTTIKFNDKSGVKLIGEFQPDAPPEITKNSAWPELPIEEHFEQVVWTAKVALPENLSVPFEISINGQICNDVTGNCEPISKTLVATLKSGGPPTTAPRTPAPDAAPIKPVVAQTAFRETNYVVQWTGRIEPATVSPGQRAMLVITATPDNGYHVYPAAVDAKDVSTNFVLREKSGLLIGAPAASSKPITVTIHPAVPPIDYHVGAVTWSLPIVVPAGTSNGAKTIAGAIAYQACEEGRCLLPQALQFTGQLSVATPGSNPPAASFITFATAPFAATMDAAAETNWVDSAATQTVATDAAAPTTGPTAADDHGSSPPIESPATPAPMASKSHGLKPLLKENDAAVLALAGQGDAADAAGLPLWLVLLMAIGGGLILNLMPCVLPVVGLKVMAFAEQAGENRSKVLALNLWYTLGILSVFWALGVTALTLNLSWGEQYTYFNFRLAITLGVFAMALSFLGVWEIPLPGFVGGNSTQKLQRKEGASGAFFKGMFTTILATPCSGPLLGPVFGYLLGQSPTVTMLVFTAIGLGMALPYLLVALYPSLLVYFPKPGAWMDTFKQLLGFMLLGTVVYLFRIFSDEHRIPVFASLIGVWFGCWIIGKVPGWADLDRRIAAWAAGLGTAALIGVLAFHYLTPGPAILQWEPYNEARLQQLQAEGKTVLVDFTARWCPNCIVNTAVAIDTPTTSKLVAELDAVPMLADWTEREGYIKEKLTALGSNSIPLLVIYPGRDPQSPIVLSDLVTQGDVLDALREAGPSVTPNGVARLSQR